MVFGFLARQGVAGGGWARRYLRIRKDVYAVQWMTPDRFPCIPVGLFDFSTHDDYVDACRVHQRDHDGWRLSDDGVIGGFSQSKARIVLDGQEDESREADGSSEMLDNLQFEKVANKETEQDFLPFLRWNGVLDTQVGLQSDARRSGFCSLRSPEFPFDGANLRGLYQGVELLCRTDGRRYTINLKVSTSVPDDIYQGIVHIEPSEEFQQIVLPFDRFRLTSRGREREYGRQLDDRVAIESIGFTLMDGQHGEFCFDLARIRAVNLFEGSIFEKPPKDNYE